MLAGGALHEGHTARAVSFISTPAFVGMREGGGMQWLTYEFAVPLAMILLIVVLYPPLYRSGIISIYG